ncbi:MAG: iron chelate uptake ABC transporter family permease subunit, partial [Phycisphaerales bacterium]
FDVMALSEDEARSVGVRIGVIRIGQLVSAGTLTAVSIVLAGPIGFVGLVCPHIVRLLAGPSHRTLLIGSSLAGIALVVGADTFVRVVSTDAGRIPIGVVTSLIGGPVFLVLLFKMRR